MIGLGLLLIGLAALALWLKEPKEKDEQPPEPPCADPECLCRHRKE